MLRETKLRETKEILTEAKKYNMLPEVVYTALQYASKYPTLTPEETLRFALNEWVK